jgi:hypothetical protein
VNGTSRFSPSLALADALRSRAPRCLAGSRAGTVAGPPRGCIFVPVRWSFACARADRPARIRLHSAACDMQGVEDLYDDMFKDDDSHKLEASAPSSPTVVVSHRCAGSRRARARLGEGARSLRSPSSAVARPRKHSLGSAWCWVRAVLGCGGAPVATSAVLAGRCFRGSRTRSARRRTNS